MRALLALLVLTSLTILFVSACVEEVEGQALPPPSVGLSQTRMLAIPTYATLRVVRDEQEHVTCYIVQNNYSERSTAVSCLRDERVRP